MRCHWSYDPMTGQNLRSHGSSSDHVGLLHTLSTIDTQGASCIGGFGQTDGRRKFELGISKSRHVSYIRGASYIREKTVIIENLEKTCFIFSQSCA